MPLITLLPNTGVQFYDVNLDLEALPRLSGTFWEERLGTAASSSGSATVLLRELVDDGDGSLSVPETGFVPPPEDTYTIGRNQAFEMHLNRWAPLPYLLMLPALSGGQPSFDRGPSNWARARLAVHPIPGPGRTHRLTLAFDTGLIPRPADGPYTGLSAENSSRQEEFGFVPESRWNGWLLDEKWVGAWLLEMLREVRSVQRRGRPLRPEDMPHACDHYARFLIMLAVLDAAEIMPRVRLLDTVSPNLGFKPVAVDLVLDIGNARACGILIEEHPDDHQMMADSYPLILRDLSRPELYRPDLDGPERAASRPFESRVEFQPGIVRARYTRAAGRARRCVRLAQPGAGRSRGNAPCRGPDRERGCERSVVPQTLSMGREAIHPGLAVQWQLRRRRDDGPARERLVYGARVGRRARVAARRRAARGPGSLLPQRDVHPDAG